MRLYYDNQIAIHIAENLVFHKQTTHIKVDCYLVCQKVTKDKVIKTRHMSSTHQLVDILTKSLDKTRLILFATSWACTVYMFQL